MSIFGAMGAGGRFSMAGFAREFVSGSVLALVTISYSLSYAALIFSGELAVGLPYGIGAAILAAGVCAITIALTSSFPAAIAGPDTPAMAVVSVLAAHLAARIAPADPGAAIAHILVVVPLSTVVTGLALYGFGALKIGRAIRFIPYPVVGGFLAASGWFLGVGALKVMTGVPLTPDTLWRFADGEVWGHLAPGLVMAVVLIWATARFRHFLVIPATLVLGALSVHLLLWVSGLAVEEARLQGWLLHASADARLWLPWTPSRMAEVEWSAVALHAGEVAAVVIVTAMAILMNATGLEVERRMDADLNRELRACGFANLLAGGLGGLVGNLSLNRSLLNARAGARGRTSGVVTGGLCLALLGVGPGLAAFMPTAVLGGMLLYMSFSLLWNWVFKSRRRLSRTDYLLVLAILVGIVEIGYLTGVIMGIAAASVSFAVNYARIRVVKRNVTGREYGSNVEWSPEATRLLRQYGSRIRILWLHGYIFFGTSNGLVEEVKRWVGGSGEEQVRWLVMSFQQVSGLDSSAVFSFVKLRHVAEKNGLHLVIAALPAEIEVAMRAEGVIGASDRTVFTFDDLDHALEWCERRLLEDVAGALNPQDRFKEWLAEEMGEATLAARFLAYLDPVSVAEGEALFRQGDPPDALYFIAHGRVSIMFAPPEGRPIRLRSMTDCTVVGEMGIYRDLMRTASVIAEEPTRTYRLERAALERMEREDLDVALAFHALIVRTLADRLAFANDEVAALER